MDTSRAALWTAWLSRSDDDAFEALVAPELDALYDAARRVGLGRHDAEDVVQESLGELAREASTRPAEVGVGAWLMRSVRLKSLVRVRGARRRRRREARARTRAETQPGRDLEVRDEVERALAGLEEADRQVLLFRYLYDLDYREIAYVLGVSPNACRIRVHRAAKRLREQLGPRAMPMLALIPLDKVPHAPSVIAAATAPATTTSALSTMLLGGLLMGTGVKVAATVLGAAAVAAGVMLGTQGGDDATPSPVADQRAPNEPTLLGSSPPPAEPTVEADLVPSPSTATPKQPVAPDPRRAWLFVHVVDPEGAPVSGARLQVFDDDFTQLASGMTLEEGRTWFFPHEATRLVAWKRGVFAPTVVEVQRPESGEEQHVRVELQPGLSISGVLEAADGQPLERTTVYADPVDTPAWKPNARQIWKTRTDAAGRFVIKGLLPGRHHLVPRIRHKGGESVGQVPRPYPQADADEHGVVIRLWSTGRFTLRPVDAATGELIQAHRDLYTVTEDGDIWLSSVSGGPVVREQTPDTVERLRVVAEGYAPSEALTLDYAKGGVLEVRLEPRPDSVGTVTFELTDAEGTPIPQFNWTRWHERDVGGATPVSYGVGTFHRDARGRLEVTLPAGAHRLTFDALDEERQRDPRYGMHDVRVTVEPGGAHTADLRLVEAGAIRISLPLAWRKKGLVLRTQAGDKVVGMGIETPPEGRLLTRIPPGRYTLELQLSSADVRRRTFDVGAGETTEVRFAEDKEQD